MKKLLATTCAILFIASAVQAADNNIPPVRKDFKRPQIEKKAPNPEQIQKMRNAKEAAFEQKLGLTEVQKLKARELRKSGHEKMKPIMEDIKNKKQEAEKIRRSNLTSEEKEQKLTVIDKDLANLKKQAQQIRKQNMKDFESILTKDQKKTLKNMKKEGRKNYDHRRKDLLPPPCPPREVK